MVEKKLTDIGNLDHNTKAEIGQSELKEKKSAKDNVKPKLKYA